MPRVKVFPNRADGGEPRLVIVPATAERLAQAAGAKLGLKNPRFVYTSTGQLVTDDSLDNLHDDDEIYVSEVEGFWKAQQRTSSFRAAILGSGGVGKSSLTLRFFRGAFTDSYDPTIEDAFRNQVLVDEVACMLDLLDTAGQEEYQVMAEQWVKKKNGFILCFSVADANSFNRLPGFLELIENEYADTVMPPFVLAGNKCDVPADMRQVTKEQAEKLAEQWGCPYVETSAKTAENVQHLFHTLIRVMRSSDRSVRGPSNVIGAANGPAKRGSGRLCVLF